MLLLDIEEDEDDDDEALSEKMWDKWKEEKFEKESTEEKEGKNKCEREREIKYDKQ